MQGGKLEFDLAGVVSEAGDIGFPFGQRERILYSPDPFDGGPAPGAVHGADIIRARWKCDGEHLGADGGGIYREFQESLFFNDVFEEGGDGDVIFTPEDGVFGMLEFPEGHIAETRVDD